MRVTQWRDESVVKAVTIMTPLVEITFKVLLCDDSVSQLNFTGVLSYIGLKKE